MVRAEKAVEEVDRKCEKSAEEMSEPRRGSKDLRGGSRKQSHALENEAGNGMFEKEQRVEGSLRTACDQAREEMHGMSMPGSLLCHRELANERQCRETVVRETRRGEVLASAHGAPRDEHFSRNETNELVRNAQTESDIGHWKALAVVP
ncbi:hypothetical protein HPB50_001991 [Hyalomma asiaticum]|uniref:Uncharacterized protein n=1 Tax=Hyalomma asiaticum TaxID=266040 RepID=A0ACB7RXT9_HYAAI|nr:hypothetical protein HPB50_001991 [Hyalomma asiaticum]